MRCSVVFPAVLLAASLGFAVALSGQPFSINDTVPVLERWMYPFNAAPCDRPAGSTFGTFGDEAGVDTRHGQHLLGWDTAALVPANHAPWRYLVRRCRVTLTINRGNLFAYDPTHDGFQTYFETNHPAYTPDADAGRPVELFGLGFRNGYDAASFEQCALFGGTATGERNAFATTWSTNGALVDAGNNVGKTNDAFPGFEAVPFAVAQTTNAAPGQPVPPGAKLTFELNLADPFVLAYVQDALAGGRLRLAVSSLHVNAGQIGTPAYPDFATQFNQAVLDPTRLQLDGVLVRDADSEADGLPDDWEQFYFGDLTHAAAGDADGDGATNFAEWLAGTDPAQPADVLRLAILRDAEGRATLRWPHAASRRYTVEFGENFSDWQTVSSPALLFPETGLAQWRDENPSASRRFYRVRVAQP